VSNFFFVAAGYSGCFYAGLFDATVLTSLIQVVTAKSCCFNEWRKPVETCDGYRSGWRATAIGRDSHNINHLATLFTTFWLMPNQTGGRKL